ncbi:tyrosine-type recombinase/integrase [Terriglobus roseus]|uniref:Integrase n=1 Tax=Terriglobus roseus TaxID=392734 RepID=A0A1H4NSA3_9BACT|nr:integrase arm-type DNA-binding domain-containing protein [Terriglobus roseus]SEB97708.1 Integrase [Terriglobus roseus]
MKLTDTRIKKAKFGEKNVRLPDGGGLFLLLTPAKGRLWRWKYRFQGKEKLMTFGTYPEVTLAAVRVKHSAARKLLKEGHDPMAERKATRAAAEGINRDSFKKIAEQWHEHWAVGKSERHADAVLRRLKADVFPAFGARSIREIEAPTLVAMVKTIEERGANDIAKRALETTGQVFRYAIAHGFASRNPAADFKPADVLKSAKKTNYARVDAKQLPALLRSIEIYQGTPVTRLAIKLLAHTFVRTGELIGGLWSEIDFEEKRWTIPAERMKMRTQHIIPLSTQSIEILELLRQLTGDAKLLLPGDRLKEKPMSNNTVLVALARMGYRGIMTGHGFRGLASTVLHEQAFPHEHIELQLAHAPRNAVSAAYNHALYIAPRVKMMQWWSDYLEAQQRGKTPQPNS